MENNIQLKETINTGTIVGLLKEKDIKLGTSKATNRQYAMGTLTIEVNNEFGTNEIKVKVMQMKDRKDGGENKLYKALETINNEYKTIVADTREQADTIKLDVQIEQNDFYLKAEDEVKQTNNIKSSIITRIDANTEHIAKIKLGGYIADIKELEDGSLGVKVIGIAYGGKAVISNLEVPANLKAGFLSVYYQGCTTAINFNIVNSVEVTTVKEDVAFGEGLGKKIEKRTRKNLVFGGDSVTPMGITADQIKEVLKQREIHLQEILVEGRNKDVGSSANMSAGFAGATPTNGTQNPFATGTVGGATNPFAV